MLLLLAVLSGLVLASVRPVPARAAGTDRTDSWTLADGFGGSVPGELQPTQLAAFSQTAWVTMVSEGGNFVGTGYSDEGVDRLFDGPEAVTVRGSLTYLEVSVTEGSQWFSLDFKPPAGEKFEDTEYAGAERYGFESPGEPGLSVSGDGSGCNREYGRFIVRDIHTDAAGQVDRLSLLYEQHCEEADGPALFGEVRFGEPAGGGPEIAEPAAVDWPHTAVEASTDEVPVSIVGDRGGAEVSSVALEGEDAGDFKVAGEDCAGASLSVGERCEIDVLAKPTATGVRTAQLLVTDASGATTEVPLAVNDVPKPPSLSDNWATIVGEGAGGDHLFDEPGAVAVSGGKSHVEVQLSEHGESFTLDMEPEAGEQLEDREYAEAGRYPFQSPGEPGLELYGSNASCSSGGRFIIKDIHFNAAGEVERLWALYEEHCYEVTGPAVFGEVRFGEQPTGAPEAVEPAIIDWPSTPVATSGYTVPVTVIAREGGAHVASVAIEGADRDDFSVSGDGCAGTSLPALTRCEIDVSVTPAAEGPRTAQLVIADESGVRTVVPLVVNEVEHRPPPPPSPDWASFVAEPENWVARKRGAARLYDTPKDLSIHGGLGHVEVRVSEGSESFSIDLAPPSGEQLEDHEYAEADGGSWGAPGSPGLSLSSGDEVCGPSYGRFIIKDIHADEAGEVERLWALYEERCQAGEPAVFGEVRYGEPLPETPEVVEPAAIDWPATPVGHSTVAVPVSVLAREAGATVKSVAIAGGDAGDFQLASDGCSGRELAAGARCEIDVFVTPRAEGPRTAELVITDRSGATTSVPLAVNQSEERTPPLPSSNWATMVGEKCFGKCFTFDRLFDALDSVSGEGTRSGISIGISAAREYFRLNFYPPAGSELEAREYADAQVSSFPSEQKGVPVMYFGWEGSACESGSGRFDITEIRFAASELDRLTLLYEIECGYRPILFGEVQVGRSGTRAPEVVMPGAIDWPQTSVGIAGDEVPVTVVARKGRAEITSIAIKGADARDFSVAADDCTQKVLSLGETCEVDVGVKPKGAGARSAKLVITDRSGSTTTLPLAVSAKREHK